MKKKLFIMADAGADTGFAQVTHNLVEHLHSRWDISILAINYNGDPHPLQKQAKLYYPAADVQGDLYGVSRINGLLHRIKPDLLFMINDPWVAASYIPYFEKHKIPRVLYTPVDGYGLKEEYIEPLKAFNHIVGYTQFAVDQLRIFDKTTPMSHLPHGVNTKLYKPISRKEARARNGFPDDWFIVNVTDRNQIRKRIDLAMHYFAHWVHTTNKPESVKIHYHGSLQDDGWDIMDLKTKLKLENRLIITAPNITPKEGLPLELMPYVYAPADVGLSETMGEGWGLTTMERMAMKIAMIVPKFSALGEWANGGVHYLDIAEEPYYNIHQLNTQGGVATLRSTVDALELMYTDPNYRRAVAERGYNLVTDSKFNWKTIADQFNALFTTVLAEYTTDA